MVGVETAIAVASLKILSSELQKFINFELKKFTDVDGKFRQLDTNLKEADNVLQSLDSLLDNDKALQLRVSTLNRLYYDVEDFINEMKHEIKKRNAAFNHKNPVRNVTRVVSLKNLRMPAKIDDLLKQLVDLNQDLKQYLNESKLAANDKVNEVTYYFDQLECMAREKNTAPSIINELINQNNSNGVSIVGIRGLGKKALAQHVLDCKEVRTKFSLILKTSSLVNHSFSTKEPDLEILHSSWLWPPKSNKDILHQDKWLLWIDEVSDMPSLFWNKFHDLYLAKNRRGIRKVLITTINTEVANETQTCTYYLDALSDECCEELISQKSLSHNPSCCVSPQIIKDVAKKCYGLPSIAILMALGLSKGQGADYQQIVDKELFDMTKFRRELLPYLTISFGCLEPHIMKCFCYLSLFPQKYEFKMEDLIMLWIGLGLVKAHHSSFQENDFFNGLLKNSILQPLPAANTESSPSRYQMNNFTHRFAQFAASKTYVRLDRCESSVPNAQQLDDINICHMSLTSDIQSELWDTIKTRKCLRTFLSLYEDATDRLKGIPSDLFSKMTKLRVLVLKNTDIEKLPNSVKSLKRLRFLDISKTRIASLPKEVCDIHTLQILKIKRSRQNISSIRLPTNFSNLTNLVFIDWEINDINQQPLKPGYMGKLVNLETLPLFEVGKKGGYRIIELQNMNCLQKSLRISNLEYVPTEAEAEKASISLKSSLHRLELVWTKLKNDKKVAEVLNGLKPHVNLKELQIVNYGWSSLPEWFMESSLALQKIHLQNCENCNILPSFGQLLSLEAIHLEMLHSLRSIDHLFCRKSLSTANGYFTKLKSLVLSDMSSLQQWTILGAKDMPQLRELKLCDCQMLETLPSLTHLTSLVNIEIKDCKALSSLPELPPSLKSLIICRTASLASRCQPQGQDWEKLAHVQTVEIDGVHIKIPTSKPPQSHPSQQESLSVSLFKSMISKVYSN